MRALLLRGGRVVDPSQGIDGEPLDLLLAEGQVAALGRELAAPEGARVLDLAGLWLVPGFIDLHVHLREPGGEAAETIQSGTAAAAAGGFTAVAAMANTSPVNDSPALTAILIERARAVGAVRVWPVAAITRGLAGEELNDFAALRAAGARAVSDDGRCVGDPALARRALEAAARADLLYIEHCEEPGLSPGWSMNRGAVAERLGRRGMGPEGEELVAVRDAILARSTGARLHLAHVSTAGTIGRIAEEKSRGARLTAEVTPHHLLLTEDEVERHGSNAKMNPPLRTAADVRALQAALVDGTIDCIATDHAPHPESEKARPFDQAPNGIVGLETAVSLCLDRLVGSGLIRLARLVELLSVAPARILKVPGGTLRVGAAADVTVLDLERRVVVDPSRFLSRSRNTPFAGLSLTGAPEGTVVGGRVVWAAGERLRPAVEA